MRYLVTVILTVCLVLPATALAGDDSQGAGLLARILAILADDCGSDVSGDANTISTTTFEVEDDGRVNTGDIVININIGDISLSRGGGGDEPGFPFAFGMGTHPYWHRGELNLRPRGRGYGGTGNLEEKAIEQFRSAMQEVDPEFMHFMFGVGRLAHTNTEFRERLEALVAEFAN